MSRQTSSTARVHRGALSLVLLIALGACAGGQGQETTGPRAGRSGQSCADLRKELDRLDARGVPSRIDAANAGRKLSSAQQAEVDLYNRLLGDYMGSRCHI